MFIVGFLESRTKENRSESIGLGFVWAEGKMSASKRLSFKIFYQNSVMFLDPSEVSVNAVVCFMFFFCFLMSFGLKAVVFNVISFQSRKFLKNKNY